MGITQRSHSAHAFLKEVARMHAEREPVGPGFAVLEMHDQIRQGGSIFLAVPCPVKQVQPRTFGIYGDVYDLRRQEFAVTRRLDPSDLDFAANNEWHTPECLGTLRQWGLGGERAIVKAGQINGLKPAFGSPAEGRREHPNGCKTENSPDSSCAHSLWRQSRLH